ncbi:mannuronate-specific alginate lyase [Pseudomonas subflava]|uniref:mannuronate-specific alginate lyase n=1 Tax=Pseudomonas subflava TaxID=2952933 RepID=UPI00207959CC|nr:mannuronate-specific alginate lyase [Pseudomonas subflava]
MLVTPSKRLVSSVAVLSALLAGCTPSSERGPSGSAALVAPTGYYRAAPPPEGKPRECEAPPPPYTGELDFPSKYQGSDSSRDTLNVAAERRYLKLTGDMREMEKGVNRMVGRYFKYGRPQEVDCAMTWLESWADAGALLSKDYNHTGMSVRKWTLGSLAGAYLRLKFSTSRPLDAHTEQSAKVERWFGQMADMVVADWNAYPKERSNNHNYWAAWSVMASAVILDRRDLFDWSVGQYRHGVDQITRDGYLPRELVRETRALSYHNYSIAPLMMVSAFAKANGLDLRGEDDGALLRLARNVEAGLQNPKIFQEKTGYEQKAVDLQQSSRFAWLEPYCALYQCSPSTEAWRRSIEPLSTYRLGGDLTQLFSGQLP